MKNKIILLQPRCGKYDLYICDLPLSLVYLSAVLHDSQQFQVVIIDQRVDTNWQTTLRKELDDSALLVGLTVMTGEPINYALDLTHFVKSVSNVPVVWGGIHPSIMPEQTISNPKIDYVISGNGEYAIYELAQYIQGRISDIKSIRGLYYKTKTGEICKNEEVLEFDWDRLPPPPYDLVDHSKYYRSGFDKKIISIMTSRNCPHRCTFCYNSSIKKKYRWNPEPAERVKKTLKKLYEKYTPQYISFIDDDFFVDLDRARDILEFIHDQRWDVKVGFRGARVDDLLKLDESFMQLLVAVNTRHINIGVESGSPKILKKLLKGITPEMTIEVNQKLAKYPPIIPLYNFFSGIPGETVEDIKMSTNLILKLIKDNPRCQISGFHQYTPYPGSSLYILAKRNGFQEPTSLEGWGQMQLENNAKNSPWIDRKRLQLLQMIYTMIYFVDKKYDVYFFKNSLIHRLIYPAVLLYRPIAKFRLRYHVCVFPLEVWAKDVFYYLQERLRRLA